MPLPCRLPGLLVLLALALPAGADVYKYYDSDGNLVLSDSVPGERAEKVEKLKPNPVMTVPALAPSRTYRPAASAVPKPVRQAGDYEIVIQSPGAESFHRRAGEGIPVAFSVTPSLQDGHRLKLLLDGSSSENLEEIVPESLGRGSHTLEVRVEDADGTVLKAGSVTFHIQQASALSPLRQTSPKPGDKKKPGDKNKK